MSDIQPIPEEIINWINAIHSNGEKKTGNWKSGAFAMYNKMQTELESLRKERDSYRHALKEITEKGTCVTMDEIVGTTVERTESAEIAFKCLRKYPTEQTDKPQE